MKIENERYLSLENHSIVIIFINFRVHRNHPIRELSNREMVLLNTFISDKIFR